MTGPDPFAPRARLATGADLAGTSQQARFHALQQLTLLERDSILWHLCSTVPGAVERAYRIVRQEGEHLPLLPDPSGILPGIYRDLPGPDVDVDVDVDQDPADVEGAPVEVDVDQDPDEPDDERTEDARLGRGRHRRPRHHLRTSAQA